MSAARPITLPGGPDACLVLHGLAGSPLEVRFVGLALNRAGLSVHIPVLEGYSMGSEATGWRDWLLQAERLYLELRGRYRSVSVAGLSSGATLALLLAARQAGVQAVAAWAATLWYDGWLIPWYRGIFKLAYRLGVGRRYAYREKAPFGLKNERWRAFVADAMLRHSRSEAGPALIPARFLYEATRLGEQAARELRAVRADTLVVHAAEDETASPRNAHAIYRRVASAHKRQVMLGDSYHIITMDNERGLVARETARFLRESIARREAAAA
jgi:carboxylesterase